LTGTTCTGSRGWQSFAPVPRLSSVSINSAILRALSARSLMISVLVWISAARCAACGMSGRRTGTRKFAHTFFGETSRLTISWSAALKFTSV
jgi:hypothetical protein